MTHENKNNEPATEVQDAAERARARRNLKSLLIEPFKQIKFGLYVLAISAVFVVACGALFVSAFMDQYQHVMSIFNVVDPTRRWDMVVNDVFEKNAIRIGCVFIAYLVGLFGVVFRLTHRYYGPLVSIERFIEHVAAGRYDKRAKIRDKDELHDFVAKLNQMADALEKRHGANGLGGANSSQEAAKDKDSKKFNKVG